MVEFLYKYKLYRFIRLDYLETIVGCFHIKKEIGMALNLDIRTLIFIIVAGHVVSIILLIFYLIENSTNKYDYAFIFGRVFQTIAWILIGFRGHISDLLSSTIGNTYLIIGFAFEAFAITSIKIKLNKKWCYIYTAILVIALTNWWNIFFYLNVELKILVVSAVISVFFIISGTAFLFSKVKSSNLQRLMGLMYIVCSFVLLLRGIFIGHLKDYNLFKHYTIHVTAFIIFYLLLLLGSIGYILVKKEYLDHELIKLASIDPLTKLYNRRAFFKNVEKQISFAIKKKREIGLLVIDIDYFKKINDTYGHSVGDLVLQNLAQAMEKSFRKYDVLGRFGGEEFVVFMPDTNLDQASEAAERLRCMVEKSKFKNIDTLKYTVSIGVASLIPEKDFQFDDIFNLGDLALYRAKKLGRNLAEVQNC